MRLRIEVLWNEPRSRCFYAATAMGLSLFLSAHALNTRITPEVVEVLLRAIAYKVINGLFLIPRSSLLVIGVLGI